MDVRDKGAGGGSWLTAEARRKGARGPGRRRRRAGADHGGGDRGDLASTYGETEIELTTMGTDTLLWSGDEPSSVERRRRGDGEYVREPPSGLQSGVEREKQTWNSTGSVELKKILARIDTLRETRGRRTQRAVRSLEMNGKFRVRRIRTRVSAEMDEVP